MGEYAFLICTSAQDTRCGCRCALGAVEYHSSPFDAGGAIPFAHGAIRVTSDPGSTRMGLILTWCGAIAACWQLQKSPHESPRRGVLAYDPTTASTHYLRFQKLKWYHGAAGRVSLSTLARNTPSCTPYRAILARFTN